MLGWRGRLLKFVTERKELSNVVELRSLLPISRDGLLEASSISAKMESPAKSSAAASALSAALSAGCGRLCTGCDFLLDGLPLPLFATGAAISPSDEGMLITSLYAAFSSIYDCGTSTTMVDSFMAAALARAEGATFCRFGRGIVQAYSNELKLPT
jgi:hypothetical protein